jgi:hypothetical protein
LIATYRAAQIFPWIGVPWTLLVALAVAIIVDPRIPAWDRAATYSVAKGMGWTLILVPLAGFAGTILAARAISKRDARRSWAICTTAANALVAVAYIPIWGLLLVSPTLPQSDYPAGLDRTPRLPIDHPEYGPEYLVYSRYTAEEMNRLLQDPDGLAHLHGLAHLRWRSEQGPPITYVPADVASDGPLVVSVNPIDDFTWGATALSGRTGRCHLKVLVRDPEHPRYGHIRDGLLADSLPCKGSEATRASTRSPGRGD